MSGKGSDIGNQWVNNTFPAGLGEPLNLIVAGDSDPDVLALSKDNGGFLNYMLLVSSIIGSIPRYVTS